MTLEVWHDGKPKEVRTSIAALDDEKTAVAQNDDQGTAAKGRLGVAVRPLTGEEKKQAEVPNGVVVENVAGAAAKAGLQPGDVIISVNSTPVNSPEQLRNVIDKAGKTVALLVQREDARIFIPVTIG